MLLTFILQTSNILVLKMRGSTFLQEEEPSFRHFRFCSRLLSQENHLRAITKIICDAR